MRRTWKSRGWKKRETNTGLDKNDILHISCFLHGQTGAWANRTAWVRTTKAGIASLSTPPQNQYDVEREGERKREKQRQWERREKDTKYMEGRGCVKCQGMHQNCVFWAQPDKSWRDSTGLPQWLLKGRSWTGLLLDAAMALIDRVSRVSAWSPKLHKADEEMQTWKGGRRFTVTHRDSRHHPRWVWCC